jgi:hypothetical protein
MNLSCHLWRVNGVLISIILDYKFILVSDMHDCIKLSPKGTRFANAYRIFGINIQCVLFRHFKSDMPLALSFAYRVLDIDIQCAIVLFCWIMKCDRALEIDIQCAIADFVATVLVVKRCELPDSRLLTMLVVRFKTKHRSRES